MHDISAEGMKRHGQTLKSPTELNNKNILFEINNGKPVFYRITSTNESGLTIIEMPSKIVDGYYVPDYVRSDRYLNYLRDENVSSVTEVFHKTGIPTEHQRDLMDNFKYTVNHAKKAHFTGKGGFKIIGCYSYKSMRIYASHNSKYDMFKA